MLKKYIYLHIMQEIKKELKFNILIKLNMCIYPPNHFNIVNFKHTQKAEIFNKTNFSTDVRQSASNVQRRN